MTSGDVAPDSGGGRGAGGLEGRTTSVYQRPHVALCCDRESPLEVGLGLRPVAFGQ